MTAAELKASILDLAVRGLIVPQREEERFEKFEGFERFEKSTVDDPPYELPRNWVWKRLGEVCHIERGGSPRPINAYLTTASNGINWIKIGDTEQGGKYIVTAAEKIKPEGQNKTRLVEPGDFLLTNSMSFGRPYICKIHGAIHDGWLRLHFAEHTFDETYLFWLLSSPFVFRQFNYLASGSGVRNLKIEKAAVVIIPLPPLPEQKRIVAKIEELMPLVEEYGAAQKELEALNADFPAALRESILQDAVQGKLTAEWRKSHRGESAADLLAQIAAERAAVGRARTPAAPRKKEKPLPPITDDEKPFEIPDTWAWCRLCNIIQSVGGRENQVLAKSVSPNGKFPVVSQGQSLVDGFSDDESKVVFDVPVIMFGDHTRNVKYVDFPFVIGADGTKFFKTASYPRWLYYWTVFQATQIGARGYGRHWGLLNEVLVALPPLAEQKAIVERVDELLKIVDAMKAQ